MLGNSPARCWAPRCIYVFTVCFIRAKSSWVIVRTNLAGTPITTELGLTCAFGGTSAPGATMHPEPISQPSDKIAPIPIRLPEPTERQ